MSLLVSRKDNNLHVMSGSFQEVTSSHLILFFHIHANPLLFVIRFNHYFVCLGAACSRAE